MIWDSLLAVYQSELLENNPENNNGHSNMVNSWLAMLPERLLSFFLGNIVLFAISSILCMLNKKKTSAFQVTVQMVI